MKFFKTYIYTHTFKTSFIHRGIVEKKKITNRIRYIAYLSFAINFPSKFFCNKLTSIIFKATHTNYTTTTTTFSLKIMIHAQKLQVSIG